MASPTVSFAEVDDAVAVTAEALAARENDGKKFGSVQALGYLVQRQTSESYEGLHVYVRVGCQVPGAGNKFFSLKLHRSFPEKKYTIADVKPATGEDTPELEMW